MHRPQYLPRHTASIGLLLLKTITLVILLVVALLHPHADRRKTAELVNAAAEKFRHNNYNGAIADLTEAIKLDPSSATLYSRRGAARLVRNDPAGAITDFDSALAINPNFSRAFWGRGLAKARLHDRSGALADFDEAIRLAPTFPDAYSGRGSLKVETRDYPGALADLNSAVAQAPENYRYLSERGSIHDLLGQYRDAIADYRGSVSLNSEYPGSVNNLAWDYAAAPGLDVADRAKAVALATKACELTHWKDPGTLDTLAAAYAAIGQYDDAIKWQRACLELAPDLPDAKVRLELYQNHQPYTIPPPKS